MQPAGGGGSTDRCTGHWFSYWADVSIKLVRVPPRSPRGDDLPVVCRGPGDSHVGLTVVACNSLRLESQVSVARRHQYDSVHLVLFCKPHCGLWTSGIMYRRVLDQKMRRRSLEDEKTTLSTGASASVQRCRAVVVLVCACSVGEGAREAKADRQGFELTTAPDECPTIIVRSLQPSSFLRCRCRCEGRHLHAVEEGCTC